MSSFFFHMKLALLQTITSHGTIRLITYIRAHVRACVIENRCAHICSIYTDSNGNETAIRTCTGLILSHYQMKMFKTHQRRQQQWQRHIGNKISTAKKHMSATLCELMLLMHTLVDANVYNMLNMMSASIPFRVSFLFFIFHSISI